MIIILPSELCANAIFFTMFAQLPQTFYHFYHFILQRAPVVAPIVLYKTLVPLIHLCAALWTIIALSRVRRITHRTMPQFIIPIGVNVPYTYPLTHAAHFIKSALFNLSHCPVYAAHRLTYTLWTEVIAVLPTLHFPSSPSDPSSLHKNKSIYPH